MKRNILIFVLCLTAAGPSFAQNNLEGMKLLTINALMQYGQKLYDRGDFNEASAVFNRVLTYDGHQIQALQYLKIMGHSPAPRSIPALQTVNVSDTESLKQAIKAEKQIIEKLQIQVMQMRANIASQSAEN